MTKTMNEIRQAAIKEAGRLVLVTLCTVAQRPTDEFINKSINRHDRYLRLLRHCDHKGLRAHSVDLW